MSHHHHNHHHDHSHGHMHEANFTKAFAFGIGLNLLYVLIETFYGFRIDSLALLSDAVHNLADVFSIAIGWMADFFIRRKSFGRYTYGLKRSSIIIAFANTLIMLVAVGAIGVEAVRKLFHPEASNGLEISLIAFIGILINAFTAWLFYRAGTKDVNIRSVFMHLVSDALISAAVVIAGLLIYYTGWYITDAIVTLLIVIVILYGTWELFRDSSELVMDAAPRNIKIKEVREYLLGLNGVTAIHDLHVWNISTRETALTVHLIMPAHEMSDAFLHSTQHYLAHHFEINHVTIQIEKGTEPCETSNC